MTKSTTPQHCNDLRGAHEVKVAHLVNQTWRSSACGGSKVPISCLTKDDISSRNSQMDGEFAFAHESITNFKSAHSKPDLITIESLLPWNSTPAYSPHMNKSYEKAICESDKASGGNSEMTKSTTPQHCNDLRGAHEVPSDGTNALIRVEAVDRSDLDGRFKAVASTSSDQGDIQINGRS
ncbi:hypothetical protein EGR_07456 [Echinococcus granulosus]|uniref:Uncharacterized protein n=1 Tax=Echinococcus granulosus TaxID=6210 RepID=W6U9N1_ECHGR|nr:hypothetical protein EGR_07456 [Echinococcus granulosus]EUB57715.1 hypothetical protein EGR_07456 [Echinococcus granulosus]